MNDTVAMPHLQPGVTLIWKDYSDINEKDGLEWETGGFQRSQVRGNDTWPGGKWRIKTECMAKGETVWLQKYLEIEWPHIGLEDWGRRGGWDWYYNNNNNNYDSNNTNKPRYIKKKDRSWETLWFDIRWPYGLAEDTLQITRSTFHSWLLPPWCSY